MIFIVFTILYVSIFNAFSMFQYLCCYADFTEVYLGPYLTSVIHRFFENSCLLKAVSCFCKKAIS